MTSVEELAEIQSMVGQAIQQLLANFKKDSSARKTTKQYYDDRIKKLEKLWDKFEANDLAIKINPELEQTHPYVTEGYYNKINNLVEEYRNRLHSERTLVPDDTEQPTTPLIVPRAIKPSIAELGATSLTYGITTPAQNTMIQASNIGLSNTNEENDRTATNHIVLLDPGVQSWKAKIRRQAAMGESLERLLEANSQGLLIENINSLWSKIEDLHYSICEQFENPQAEGYNTEMFVHWEKRVYEHRAKTATANLNATTQLARPAIQLPKIAIPKFDGNYLQWQQFADIFQKMIHEQHLPDIQKMWYLKTNISGEAERLIRHLNLSAANYTTAWDLMQDRFNNK